MPLQCIAYESTQRPKEAMLYSNSQPPALVVYYPNNVYKY